MYISQRGLDLIKKYEGFIGQSYDDYDDHIVNAGGYCRGTLTIGYGHIEGVYKGQTITEPEANELLKSDMRKYCSQVDEELSRINVPFEVNQGVYDSLCSFCYNCGQGSLRTLLAGGSRNKQTVADMLLEYRNKGSVWEQGLLRRRREERELFLNGGNYEGGVMPSNIQDTRVKELQHLCNVIIGANIDEDNIWGNQTENAVRQLPLCGIPYTQPQLTIWVQSRLGCTPDGIFLYETANAVGQWQSQHNLVVDKIVGYNTYKSLALD